VVFATPVLMPKYNEEKMMQIVFEEWNSPLFFRGQQTALSLLTTGKKTGFVFDFGHGSTQLVPVVEGVSLTQVLTRFQIQSLDLDSALHSRVTVEDEATRDSPIFREAVRRAKEQLCFVSEDVESEIQRGEPSIPFEHSVGDCKISMSLGNERFLVPECIFNPRVVGMETWGVQDAIQTVIGRCDHAVQAELYGNVVLTGKGSLLRGFDRRLQVELEKKAPEGTAVCVTRTPNPSYSS